MPSATSERYQRASVFFRPDQRQWLKHTLRDINLEGLSASDLVRLAVDRLAADVDTGLPVAALLTAKAHEEAETFAGRRARGLPARLGA